MSQLVTQKESFDQLSSMIQSENVMVQVREACAGVLTPDRMMRVALTEVRKNPKLLQCSQASFLGAMLQCAQVGLEPGLPLGHAFIIPYGKDATFQLGYKGLIALMWRSEHVASIQAEVVYEGDEFEYENGIPPKLRHKPIEVRHPDAKPTHAYCCIETTKGGWFFRVRTYEQIEAVRRKYSKSRTDSPWVSNWDEMAAKTVIKLAGKLAPVSAEASRAIALDDMQAQGIKQDNAAEVDIEIEVGPVNEPCPTCNSMSDNHSTRASGGFNLICPNEHVWIAAFK